MVEKNHHRAKTPPKRTVTVTTTFQPDEFERLSKVADYERRRRADFVRVVVLDYVERHERLEREA